MLSSIELTALRLDGETQPRNGTDRHTIAKYAESLDEGALFPPVIVFIDPDGLYWLADGFHRVEAHRLHGSSHINADVREGSKRDAILYATGANATHGLPRTNSDKRRAVLTLLSDVVWSVWSDREIARRTATSQPFVSKMRADQRSDNVITHRTSKSSDRLRTCETTIRQGSEDLMRSALRANTLIRLGEDGDLDRDQDAVLDAIRERLDADPANSMLRLMLMVEMGYVADPSDVAMFVADTYSESGPDTALFVANHADQDDQTSRRIDYLTGEFRWQV